MTKTQEVSDDLKPCAEILAYQSLLIFSHLSLASKILSNPLQYSFIEDKLIFRDFKENRRSCSDGVKRKCPEK